MERCMRQNSLVYNRQTSDSQKLIIGCRSLEIKFTFTQFRKLIFGNRYSRIDLWKSIFKNYYSLMGIDIWKLIFGK